MNSGPYIHLNQRKAGALRLNKFTHGETEPFVKALVVDFVRIVKLNPYYLVFPVIPDNVAHHFDQVKILPGLIEPVKLGRAVGKDYRVCFQPFFKAFYDGGIQDGFIEFYPETGPGDIIDKPLEGERFQVFDILDPDGNSLSG